MLIVCLYIVIFPIFVSSQFLSYDAVRMRVPGRCSHGDFDCGLSQCVPISQFRDGKPDCMDGSDEWCFIGQVSCGPVYCADYKDALACIVYPKCDGSSKQLPWCSISKEKLCTDKRSFPCKGYGECVLWEWLMDGKKDCIDGSDEDENYVMPLENAFRMERNRTGLVLPQPIPPPPEDHPSLYVQGCSFCPNAGSPTPKPPASEYGELTTPKDPFAATAPFDRTKPPLSNFPSFPSFPTEDPKVGEFFPGITFSKVTKNTPLGEFFPTLIPPSNTIVTIPPPPITQNHIYPESVRIITLPSPLVSIYPKPPLIFPPITDNNQNQQETQFKPVTKSTQTSGMGNWPIPTQHTNQPEIYGNTYQPITYPSIQGGGIDNRIPPVNPAIIITRPVKPPFGSELPYIIQTATSPHENLPKTSFPPNLIEKSGYVTGDESTTDNSAEIDKNSGVGFKPIKVPTNRPIDSPSPNSPYDSVGETGNKHVETLIPLVPGHLLPTFQTRPPIQHSTPIYYVTTTQWPTQKGSAELEETESREEEENEERKTRPIIYPGSVTHAQVSTKTTSTKSPAFVPLEPDMSHTHHPYETTESSAGGGWIIETHGPIPTSKSTKVTNPNSKIIHVGPDGVIQPSSEEKGTEVTEGPESGSDHEKGNVDNGTEKPSVEGGSQKVIHVGSTNEPSAGTLLTTTEPTPTIENTKKKTKSGSDREENDSCLKQLMGDDDTSVVCECENGKFKNAVTGKCDEYLSLLNVKIKVNSICDSEYVPLETKQRIIHEKISRNLKQRSCIKPKMVDHSFVATIACENCELEEIHRMLNVKTAEEHGVTDISTEALGSGLCDGLDYNHCHVYADCVVDNEGLRYACRCKSGTVDISNGYGRNCEGFPEDSDCVMVFGICLIVWLLFLLGVFMLTCLLCLASFYLCRKRCCGHVAIHPATPDGLQRVIISSKAKQTMESSEKLPHMRALFAETLKHSAKGPTSIANAFAFADFRRKKVSKTPEMSQVIEENMSPSNSMNDVRLPEVHSLPKVSSLAKLSTHTTVSEPTTPGGIIETPILEKNSSSVSLISANAGNADNSPQLPSLPLPLPVPLKTNTPATNLEDKKDDSGSAKLSDGGSQERPSSSNSIGVQPTIWETYRVLGQQYSKGDPNERKPSVDSLEMMFEARLAETARTARANAAVGPSENSPITFIAKPTFSLEENGLAAKSDASKDSPSVKTDSKEEVDDQGNARSEPNIEQNLENAAEKKKSETDSKVADMIGVTSYHVPRGMTNRDDEERKFDEDVANQVNISENEPSSLEKSLEAALLIEMAKRGIELPLSPKTPIPTSDESEKIEEQNKHNKQNKVDQYEGDVDLDMKPSSGKKSLSRKSSIKSTTSGQKTKIPSSSSSSQSRNNSATSRKSVKPEIEEKPSVFVPSGARGGRTMRGGKSFLKRGAANDGTTTTDESDPEIAFFKRLETMREDIDRYQVHPPNHKYSRRRKPERTLSSISEKSAEVSAEAGIDYPVDTSISCPATTRSYLEPKPIPRYFFKRKVVEASGESSDVDIPKSSPVLPPPPVMNSPDIPDVSYRRSRENLHQRLESPPEELVSPRNQSHIPHSKKVSRSKSIMKPEKEPRQSRTMPSSMASSQRSSRVTSRAASPRNGDDTASHTSRSTRHSVISRKIAIRKHELKAVSGSAYDLTQPQPSRTGLPNSSMRSAKSVDDLSRQRPGWDISQHRESTRPTEFLPPIVPSRGARTTVNSPQPRHRRSDSHYSLASLPASHSPTSFWSSPYFNPSEDSKKPPKEDLWWNPNKNL